jgi:S-adenosylmethionine:tRNA ribosyltransferase-isomerase
VNLDAFDYDLAPGRVAQQPVEPRDSARLLVDAEGDGTGRSIDHRRVRDLPALIESGDLVVLNDTRVLPARLLLRRASGGAVEVLLLEPLGDHGAGWQALVRPGRKVAPGTVLAPRRAGLAQGLGVEVGEELGGGRRRVVIHGPDRSGGAERAAIDAMGVLPLPPYITEALGDPDRYQTVYSRRAASAAAPTAGLHFTTTLLERIGDRGIEIAAVELVVGLDTFRPISAHDIEDHHMHSEAYRVPEATWAAVEATRARGGRVIAVGTTVVRALESAARRGQLEGRTDLYIRGDYPFAVVDRLLTNFHLPRSSLLVLIDAFVGARWRELYREAMDQDYRFLSFGDALLLTRKER